VFCCVFCPRHPVFSLSQSSEANAIWILVNKIPPAIVGDQSHSSGRTRVLGRGVPGPGGLRVAWESERNVTSLLRRKFSRFSLSGLNSRCFTSTRTESVLLGFNVSLATSTVVIAPGSTGDEADAVVSTC
jgi:hypothetical protein